MFIVARQPYLSLRPFMGGMISLLPELEAIALVVAITSRHYVAKISPVNTNVLIRRLAAVIKYVSTLSVRSFFFRLSLLPKA